MILGISYFTPRNQCSAQRLRIVSYKTTPSSSLGEQTVSSALQASSVMSQAHTTASTNFQLIINNALDNYKKCTKNDLITHPLTAQLQSCNSPSDVLAVLHRQVHELDYPRTDERWSKWLDPTVNVIYVLSSTLAAGVTMVCLKTWTSRRSADSYIFQVFSPANVIFAGIGILLSVCIFLLTFV